MTEDMAVPEALDFRAEVQQLLNILAHSLYTEREIFLRELISNASDALNRVQFETLTNRDMVDGGGELAIRVSADETAHTLTVSDNGIGMTHDELIENLGTIAHSGALAFLKNLEEGKRPADIIGQFGVGFYSVFMVADEVTVTTRSYRPDAGAWRWSSRGDSRFTLAPAQREARGTTIEIKLKEDAHEFIGTWRLEQTVRRHSNYISFPIYVGDKVVNQQAAPWRKPLSEVQANEYDDFFRQLTLDPDPPLLHVHVITDAPVEIRSILFVPRKFEHSPLRVSAEHGLKLYSKKVLIQDENKDLLPEYLRFVEGVVDSEDLPLNISRETVQSNRVLRQIQKVLTSRVLKALRDLAADKPAEYGNFWQEFGAFVKQGAAISPSDQDDLVPLLRFYSSNSGADLVDLAGYVTRMASDQNEIYYILATDQSAASHSPHLDPFKLLGLEVLYLLDPFDGFLMQGLREYQGKAFRNVDDPTLELTAGPPPEEPAVEAASQPDLAPLLAHCKQVLGDRVTEVRASQVLTDSPARLISTGPGAERDLLRVRRLLDQDYKLPVQMLELNPRHPIVRNLAGLLAARPNDPVLDASIEQLFANSLLLEGLHPNPADMVPRLQTLLEAATRGAAG